MQILSAEHLLRKGEEDCGARQQNSRTHEVTGLSCQNSVGIEQGEVGDVFQFFCLPTHICQHLHHIHQGREARTEGNGAFRVGENTGGQEAEYLSLADLKGNLKNPFPVSVVPGKAGDL